MAARSSRVSPPGLQSHLPAPQPWSQPCSCSGITSRLSIGSAGGPPHPEWHWSLSAARSLPSPACCGGGVLPAAPPPGVCHCPEALLPAQPGLRSRPLCWNYDASNYGLRHLCSGVTVNLHIILLLDRIDWLVSERKGERDGNINDEGESCMPPTGDGACNPGICP
uniref:Uncharacterized protein n=1 Tax=Pipistrellus kuhlii TaxID=59472 RepID=A0A7J7S703_PIPKU|nr:hypothetical protein mPipKuh1_010016 [Pipistrellus kuhlii]